MAETLVDTFVHTQAESQRDKAAAAAALLQQQGQYLEQEAFKEVQVLKCRIQQLMTPLS